MLLNVLITNQSCLKMLSYFHIRRKFDPRDVWAWGVFGIVVLATCLIGVHVRTMIHDSAQRQFAEITQMQRDLLINRMKDYEQVLLGAAGLFNSSERVDRREWREYVDSLRLHLTLPGIQGVGYAEMVPPENKKSHEARIRAEGFPNYAISPAGERELYSGIIYLEPFSGRNLRAFGYDMYSEPVRHAAMQRAADTQDPAWTGKVRLVQEDGQGKPQPGFLVYVPIYAKNLPLRTVAERRGALEGFVYSPFRAWDLMGQLYQDPKRLFELQLYDGAVNSENLLYESSVPDINAQFSQDLAIDVGGVRWTARFTSNANFNRMAFSELPLMLFVASLGMEFLLFMTFLLDSRRRKHIEITTEALAKSNREIRLMASLTQRLQNCNHEEETFPILSAIMMDLLPGVNGACYLMNHSETQLDRVSAWGDQASNLPGFFMPDACWAYRRGRSHSINRIEARELRCAHVSDDVATYTCMPLVAQGKTFGVLYLEQPPGTPVPDADFTGYGEVLRAVADTVSLSLSNLRLRSSLTDLAIRDSLTGLYNRRYMEESLERELERAQRQGHDVAVIMLDVDHFKQLNDSYGHEAGDIMLKRISDQMKHFRSGSDVVCRFGGEEFVLILPDMAEPILRERLETLRHDIELMQVNVEGRIMPVTTVSIGVARFPVDAQEAADLVRIADAAMYRAKQAGRNRIEWSGTLHA